MSSKRISNRICDCCKVSYLVCTDQDWLIHDKFKVCTFCGVHIANLAEGNKLHETNLNDDWYYNVLCKRQQDGKLSDDINSFRDEIEDRREKIAKDRSCLFRESET